MKKISVFALLSTVAALPTLNAADISMAASDGFGASSFNSGLNWVGGLAPTAGNNYLNAGFLMRTPATTSSYTFAGDALTITGAGLASAVNNEALMWKGSGTAAIITVNNLTINGGQLRHGQGSADTVTFAGSIAIGPNNANFGTQGGMIINSSLSGSSTIRILDNGSGEAARTVTFGSSANTFTGNVELFGTAATRARLALADNANLNFVIGANGVNNRVFGMGTAAFDGDFAFNLAGASANLGDSWTIASAAAQTFGSTFTVAGFNNEGSGYWSTAANGGFYVFDQSKGVLEFANAVPEPSSLALAFIGAATLLGARRMRQS